MDNAADALKMAGSVLLFVLALSIVVPLFTEARITADTIMSYADREAYQNNADDSMDEFFFYIGKASNGKVRKVGLDTVIPAIYRSYKENFKVVFVEGDINNPFTLYEYKKNGIATDFNSIDLKYTSIASGNEKEFINGIVYGKFGSNSTSDEIKEFEKKFGVKLYTSKPSLDLPISGKNGLYDYIKDKDITEYLGVYYQEDVEALRDLTGSINDALNKVPEAQKDEKRVITYCINN